MEEHVRIAILRTAYRKVVLEALLEGPADDGAPLPEEYPADDDIPESDY